MLGNDNIYYRNHINHDVVGTFNKIGIKLNICAAYCP